MPTGDDQALRGRNPEKHAIPQSGEEDCAMPRCACCDTDTPLVSILPERHRLPWLGPGLRTVQAPAPYPLCAACLARAEGPLGDTSETEEP